MPNSRTSSLARPSARLSNDMSRRGLAAMRQVLRHGDITADPEHGPGQVQALDPPTALLFLVCLAVVPRPVQLAAIAEDNPVFHCPNAGCGGGRREGDLRGVAMVHGGGVLEASHHHRNEVVGTLHR